MKRVDIINKVGREYLTENVENGEYSYPKAYKEKGLAINPIQSKKTGGRYELIDIRFVKDDVTVLVETKVNFTDDLEAAKEQLAAYVKYEKEMTGNKTVGILANTTNNQIKVWRGAIVDNNLLDDHYVIKTMEEYKELYTSKINNKETVMKNTYTMNELLHSQGVSEKLRSQFVGTCLLALKNGLDYKNPNLTTSQIIVRIREILEDLLDKDMNRVHKLALLDNYVLKSQDIRELDVSSMRKSLQFIDEKILPFINDKSTAGQDLLNLFFTTFNKYVGKSDKNQAFTPDHITDFMSKITKVNRKTTILDPCCGSGAFLVRAMTIALDDCSDWEEQEKVKKNHLHGIEYDENVYGLATTNMLIHGDGNSNIQNGSCFDFTKEIKEAAPDVVLMNPPFNAQKKHLPKEFTETWGKNQKEDPTKGLYFVKYIADTLNSINKRATISVILPISCAIGSSKALKNIKEEILEENTLDAVFTLPDEIFYPGASASACCMVFKTGTRHTDSSNPDTFFGYYKEDGFKKKKNLGRVEQINPETGVSRWVEIENKWVDLYKNRVEEEGLSAIQKVDHNDEWLCEAYMKTDYSKLTDKDFQETINNYLAYLIKEGHVYEA